MENIKLHPIYRNFGYDVDKNLIIRADNNTYPKVQDKSKYNGSDLYLYVSVVNNEKQKTYLLHRFIWECCNDLIPKGYEIDHINHDKHDYNITNLRCVSISQNRKNRDHTNIINIAKNAHKMKRSIKAINKDNKSEFYCFRCKSQCAKYFNISPAMIYLICEHKNNAKYAHTIKGIFYFEYIDEHLITNLIIIPDSRLDKKHLIDKNKTYKTSEAQRKANQKYREKLKQQCKEEQTNKNFLVRIWSDDERKYILKNINDIKE